MLACFLPVLGGGAILSDPYCDVAFLSLYKRQYLGEALLHGGRGLLWNPFMFAGMPFVCTGEAAVFYPASWLFALLPAGPCMNFVFILHFWMGLAAMYLFARWLGLSRGAACVAALLFELSGVPVVHQFAGHVSFLCGWPWTVGMVWGWAMLQEGDRRGLLVLPASFALQVFSGHPQMTYITLVLLLCLHVGWTAWAGRAALRGTLLALAAGVGGAVLSLVQLLPIALYSGETIRAGKVPSWFYQTGSSPLSEGLCALVAWPYGVARAYVSAQDFWEATLFLGAPACLMMAAGFLGGRRAGGFAWTLLGALVFTWLLALGRYGFLHEALFHVLPGLSLFRNPGRFLYAVTFAAALLAAIGFDRLLAWGREDRAALRRALIGSVLAAVVGAGLLAWGLGDATAYRLLLAERLLEPIEPAPSAAASAALFRHMWSGVGWALASLVAAGICAAALPRRGAAAALVGLQCTVLLHFAAPCSVAFHPWEHGWPAAITAPLQAAGPRFRLGSSRFPSDTTQGMVHGVRNVWGFDAGVSYRYGHAIEVSQGFDGGFPPDHIGTAVITPLTLALGMRHQLIPARTRPADPRWKAVTAAGDWALYECREALPRGYVVGRAAVLKGDPAVAVHDPLVDLSKVVLLEEEPVQSGDGSGEVAPVRDDPERYEAVVTMRAPGWFVLMDAFVPGWTAEVDGQPAKIWRANAVGRAIPLGPGAHRVGMRYVPPGIVVGAAASAVGWLLWIALLIRGGSARGRWNRS